jgi:hypothetical protein
MNVETPKYEFSIELYDGQELRWVNLTRHQAQSMYKWANQLQQNYKGCRWEEMR